MVLCGAHHLQQSVHWNQPRWRHLPFQSIEYNHYLNDIETLQTFVCLVALVKPNIISFACPAVLPFSVGRIFETQLEVSAFRFACVMWQKEESATLLSNWYDGLETSVFVHDIAFYENCPWCWSTWVIVRRTMGVLCVCVTLVKMWKDCFAYLCQWIALSAVPSNHSSHIHRHCWSIHFVPVAFLSSIPFRATIGAVCGAAVAIIYRLPAGLIASFPSIIPK